MELSTNTANALQPEMIINRDEVQFIRFLPTCPKCKRTNDIVFFNVTKVIYECMKCHQRFRFA